MAGEAPGLERAPRGLAEGTVFAPRAAGAGRLGATEPVPRFSVVVPTHARPRQLAVCLEALAAQDYPRDSYEAVVVDDGSPEAPAAQVDAVAAKLDVTLVSQRRAGPAAARNAGAARASGELVAFTDDDCAPERDWLSALGARLARGPDAMIGGRTINALAGNPYSTAAQAIVSHLYAYYNVDPANGRFLASNNIALPLEGFREIGGFDTRFPRAAAEDREFCDRWRRHANRIVFAPEAIVRHAHALTPRSFWRQQFEYGRGAYWYQRLRAEGEGSLRPEPPRFYVDLLRRPFEEDAHWSLVVAALVVVSQVANALGFGWERVRPRSQVT